MGPADSSFQAGGANLPTASQASGGTGSRNNLVFCGIALDYLSCLRLDWQQEQCGLVWSEMGCCVMLQVGLAAGTMWSGVV